MADENLRSVQEMIAAGLDNTVEPYVHVRGMLSKTSAGNWVYPGSDAGNFRVSAVGVVATLSAGDIEIGAVEIKNGATDDRASVISAAPTTEFGLVTRNIPSGTQAVDTELPTATSLGDGVANPTTPVIGIIPLEFNGTTYDRKRHSWVQATTGITAASNGTVLDFTTDPQKMFAVVAKMQGDTATFDVRLEASLDNSNWTELLAITNVSPGDGKLGFAIDKPTLYLRYRVAGITRTTGTLDITILATE